MPIQTVRTPFTAAAAAAEGQARAIMRVVAEEKQKWEACKD